MQTVSPIAKIFNKLDPERVKKLNADLIAAVNNYASGDRAVNDARIAPVVRDLLRQGADPNTLVYHGSNEERPLLTTANRGLTATVSELLAAGAEADRADNNGMTPLIWASFGAYAEVMNDLLAHGADPFRKDSVDDRDALHCLVCEGSPSVTATVDETGEVFGERQKAAVQSLLANGCMLRGEETSVIYNKRRHLASFVHGMEDDLAFEKAVADGDIAAAQAWLDKGMPPDAAAAWGAPTALHLAALNDDHAMIKLLARAGAMVDAEADGKTPLQKAVIAGKKQAVMALLEEGADPTLPFHQIGGEPPLSLTQLAGRSETPGMKDFVEDALRNYAPDVSVHQTVVTGKPLRFKPCSPGA